MNISINVGEEAPKDLAGKVRAWEQIAARHIAAGDARVLSRQTVLGGSSDLSDSAVPGKPATTATLSAAVGSVAPLLYEGVSLSAEDLGDMFNRIRREQMKTGKTDSQACMYARDQCNQRRASSGGA